MALLAQAAVSPVSGLVADKADRTHVVAAGCLIWGVMTSVIGLSTSLPQVGAENEINIHNMQAAGMMDASLPEVPSRHTWPYTSLLCRPWLQAASMGWDWRWSSPACRA